MHVICDNPTFSQYNLSILRLCFNFMNINILTFIHKILICKKKGE